MLYADENDVNKYLYDTYGVKSGDLAGHAEWIGFELYDSNQTETGLTFNSTVTSITVANGTIYKAGMYLKSGSELLFITGITGNILTVKRGFKTTTAAAGTTLTIQTAAEKVNACQISTEEINSYHNQSYIDYLYLADDLKEIAILNAMEISKLFCAMDQADYIRAVSSGSYFDGVLDVAGAGSRKMSARIKNLLQEALYENGYEAGIILRR